MLDLAAMAIDVLSRPAKRIRSNPGQWVNGHFVPGPSPITTDIMASIQPVDAETLQQLPEGERSEASKAIWSRTDLRTAFIDANDQPVPADVVEADGAKWKVIRVLDRPEGGYTKVVAGRFDG